MSALVSAKDESVVRHLFLRPNACDFRAALISGVLRGLLSGEIISLSLAQHLSMDVE